MRRSSIGAPLGVRVRIQRRRPASVMTARRRFSARLKASLSMSTT
jgi:hypothetical protein